MIKFLSISCICLVANVFCKSAQCQQMDGEAFALEQWKAIREVTGDPKDPLPDYWFLIAVDCQEKFIALAKHVDRASALRCFLRNFGQDGAMADIRWVLSAPEFLLISDRDSFGEAEYDQLQEEIASIQIELLLKDRNLLHRYFELNLYLTSYFGRDGCTAGFPVFAHRTSNLLIRKNSKNLSRDIRNALLIVYATGRDDLLEDPEGFVSNTDTIMRDWSNWFEVNQPFLEIDEAAHRWRGRLDPMRTNFDIPDLTRLLRAPFTDWPTDVLPPTSNILSGIMSGGGILSRFEASK